MFLNSLGSGGGYFATALMISGMVFFMGAILRAIVKALRRHRISYPLVAVLEPFAAPSLQILDLSFLPRCNALGKARAVRDAPPSSHTQQADRRHQHDAGYILSNRMRTNRGTT
jgi:hypothetical protein